MKKLSIFFFIAILLVAVFSATSVFAESGPTLSFVLGDNPQITQAKQNGRATFTFPSDIQPGLYDFFNNLQFEVTYLNNNPNILNCRYLLNGSYSSSATFYPNNTYDLFFSSGNFINITDHSSNTGKFTGSLMLSSISPTISLVNGGDFIWTYPSSVIGEVLDFALSPGYAYVIEGEFEILERSYYINNSWNFINDGSTRLNGSINRVVGSSLIQDGFSPDHFRPSSEFVHWEALNPNLFGTASNYEFYSGDLITISNPGSAYVITYPRLYGSGSNNSVLLYENSVDMICSVYINYTTRPIIRFIAIESLSEYSSNGDFSTYSVFRPGVYDEEGVSTSGSGGTVVVPPSPLPSGGGNTGQPSPTDEDTSLIAVLQRFINHITGLFTSAINAIQTLVAEGTSFMQSIATMFTWLPSPLLSVIIGGLTILLVVGVLKVLWR